MPVEELIGVDVGAAHIGVARGNSLAKIAEPLMSLSADSALAKIAELAKQNQSQAIVVGLPRNLKGEDTAQTDYVRQWVAQAKQSINLPFYWQDEALTSVEASVRAAPNSDEHASAAAILLQDFLNTDINDRMIA